MATYLTRTASSTTDAQRKTWTLSFWVKPANMNADAGGAQEYHYVYQTGGGSTGYFRMDSNQKIRWRDYTSGGSPDYLKITNRLFRDPSAWYHIVLRCDTTQATAADRIRLYVNGELQEWQNANYPAQNHVTFINSTNPYQIGESSTNSLRSTYLSQYIMCAGQSYAPTAFGSTNANGIWVPISQPSVTYGANGFKLDFAGTGTSADASGFGADTSGNNNHFATTALGTNPNTKDTPQNNFCTFNGVAMNRFGYPILAEGNLKITDSSNGIWRICGSSQGFTSGKWYWETRYTGSNAVMSGFLDVNNYTASRVYSAGGDQYPGNLSGSNSFGYRSSGTIYYNGSTTSGKTSWESAGDIMGLAVDMDNKAVYAHVNGTYVDSGDPTSGASRTGSLFNFSTPAQYISPAVAVSAAGNNGAQMNWGNPPFTISSGNADANGYGNFEYAVPSGYYAVCTKNLAQYG